MNFAAGCVLAESAVLAWCWRERMRGWVVGPVSFSLFILFSFHRGGKFSFCQFAEKKNRGTGRKLAISWKSKLPSAAETGASYFQKMAQALPSSIMHSGIQNRNKEMALDLKKIHHSSSIWILARFNSILVSPNCDSYPCVFFRILVPYRTFFSIGSSVWWIRYNLSHYKKKKIMISNKNIICKKRSMLIAALSENYFSYNLFYIIDHYLSIFRLLHWIHLRSND